MQPTRKFIERGRSAKALRESEERFRALIETVGVGLVISGPNAEVLSSNPAARDLLGVTEEELLGSTCFDPKWNCVCEDGSPCLGTQHPILRAIASRQPVRNIVLGVDRPALEDRVWLLVNAQPQFAADGSVVRVICSFQDITVRKRTEDELRRSEAHLAAVQRLSHTGSWAWNLSTEEVFWSHETFRIFGFEPPASPAKKLAFIKDFLQRIHPEDRRAIEEGLNSAKFQTKSYEVDYRLVLPDGSIKHIQEAVYPVTNDSGEVVERYGAVMDVTERKQALEELRRRETKYRTLIDLSPGIIWTVDREGRITFMSRGSKRIYGYEPEELMGRNFQDFMPPEPLGAGLRESADVLAGRASAGFEYVFQRKDGTPVYLSCNTVALRDDQGHVTGTMAVSTDITERKRAEDMQGWLASFPRLSPDPVIEVELTGHVTFCNPAAERLFPGITSRSSGHPLLAGLVDLERACRASATGGFQREILVGDVWYRQGAFIVPGTQHLRLYGFDITENKRAEEALRNSENHFRSLFDNMLNAAAYLKVHFDQSHPVDFTYLDVNKAFETQTGFKHLAGKRASEAFPGLYKSDPELFERFGRVALTRESERFEIYVTALGKWHSISAYSPQKEYVIVVFNDITERKRAEEQRQHLLGQLRLLAARVQKAREEEGKRMAREIHDELGQALTAIKIELSSMVRDLPADRDRQSKDILEMADGAIQSVRRICTELRPAILDDLGPMAAVEWAAGEFSARTGTRCRLDLPPDEIVIDQDCATALFRIFQETLTNVARHANATEVRVRLAKEEGKLALEVRDNGKGITEKRLSAKGSLGILGMRERALLVGGEFTITGSAGKGTTVRVRIPETAAAPPKDDE